MITSNLNVIPDYIVRFNSLKPIPLILFLDLHLTISNDTVSTKIYDKNDDFNFEIVKFPFLDDDVPRSTSYGVYISQRIRFTGTRAPSHVADFTVNSF